MQVEFVIFQTKEFAPTLKPVTPEFAALAVVTAPEPDSTVQEPVPTLGVFAAKVAVLAHTD